MSEPTKPPFFQIHLSTAIVLMFVAGALVWANVTSNEIICFSNKTKTWAPVAVHGWPIYADRPAEHPGHFLLWAANIFVGCCALVVAGGLFEWITRCHEARNP